MPWAYTAIGIYNTAFNEQNKIATDKWPHVAIIKERIDIANALIKTRTGVRDFWTSAHGQQPYQCASCHSDR